MGRVIRNARRYTPGADHDKRVTVAVLEDPAVGWHKPDEPVDVRAERLKAVVRGPEDVTPMLNHHAAHDRKIAFQALGEPD